MLWSRRLCFYIFPVFQFSARRFHLKWTSGCVDYLRNSSSINRSSLYKFSTNDSGNLLLQARDSGKLTLELEHALDERRFDDFWVLFNQHLQMEGFPRKPIVNKLIWKSGESLCIHNLQRAHVLAVSIFEHGKHDLLEKETVLYLSFCLAKCGAPVEASTLLRNLIETGKFPHVSSWSATVAHMTQTSGGAFLAAEMILEIGYLFVDEKVDPRKKINRPLMSMKPNAKSFSIVLSACILFGITRKAEQILDMIPRIKVKPDATLLVSSALVYEKNGCVQELKKLERFVSEACDLDETHFLQFHNSLLSCHLNTGDLSSSSQMILEMLRKAKDAQNFFIPPTDRSEHAKKSEIHASKPKNPTPHISYHHFISDPRRVDAEVEEQLESGSWKLRTKVEYVRTDRGVLQPTDKTFMRLVKAFMESGKTGELARFLKNVNDLDPSFLSSDENSAVNRAVNACISLRWLDRAHDLLDEMRLTGIHMDPSIYASLLKAYRAENQIDGVEALLNDARRDNVQLDASCYDTAIDSRARRGNTEGALSLFKEMKESRLSSFGRSGEVEPVNEVGDIESVGTGVSEWNVIVRCFCKKRLMGDAEKAVKKMKILGFAPNAQTFHCLVMAYAAIGGKYVEVAELWGEMKSVARSSFMKFDQELLDSLLYVFVRGGFFVRANEVVEMMEKGDMFIDRYKYRTLYLKYHRKMYRGRPPKFQTEAQEKKRDATLLFKRWIGLT